LDWVAEYPCFAPGSLEYDKVLTDEAQNVYLCGSAISDVSPFLNGGAILTQKYDSAGNLLWQEKFDGLFGDSYYDSGFSNENSIVTGGLRSTMPQALPQRAELVSYDTGDGHTQWFTYLFDTIQQGANLDDIDFDSERNIYAFGTVNSHLEEYDSNKMYVCKISPTSGEIEWMHIFQNEFNAKKGKVLNDRIRVYGGKFLGQFNYVNILMDLDLNGNILSSVDIPNLPYGPGIFNNYFFFDPEGYFIGFGYYIYKFGPVANNPVWAFDFARGLPNMKGQARTAVSDSEGNIYATGALQDTLTSESYTQTLKLSPDGELIWATVSDFPQPCDGESGQRMAVSDKNVFVCSTISYLNSGGNPSYKYDYWNILYSNEDGSVVYDTLIDANVQDYAYYVHYDRNHFYFLGRSYDPASSSQADYMYKLFKYTVDGPSSTKDGQRQSAQMHLAPNPTASTCTVSYQLPAGKLVVTDVLGTRRASYPLAATAGAVQLEGLSSGVYFVTMIVNGGAVQTQKLVVRG